MNKYKLKVRLTFAWLSFQATANHVLIVMHMRVDSGLVIVGFITMVYVILVFTLLVYVKYEWCDLLFKNNTVTPEIRSF